ncbi:hypothetical protein DFH08DRAFT_943551 [Mycena albidolilacea]|uniref:Uncharacterized protein n=1 Tax=Mycena albidolilacea TaxID=1033008 RepID=A0AAD7EDJ9_9AGAR|nr:hypothetical protein DFH08DRAFT_943551 [Mycena albidolilacea]
MFSCFQLEKPIQTMRLHGSNHDRELPRTQHKQYTNNIPSVWRQQKCKASRNVYPFRDGGLWGLNNDGKCDGTGTAPVRRVPSNRRDGNGRQPYHQSEANREHAADLPEGAKTFDSMAGRPAEGQDFEFMDLEPALRYPFHLLSNLRNEPFNTNSCYQVPCTGAYYIAGFEAMRTVREEYVPSTPRVQRQGWEEFVYLWPSSNGKARESTDLGGDNYCLVGTMGPANLDIS